MKKIISLFLALVMCLSLCACGGNSIKKAFNESKEAFEYVTTAYIATNEFSQDIYEAWYLGINDKYTYNDESELASFAGQMNIELEHIRQAIANLCGKDKYSYSDKLWESLYKEYNYSHFSAWVAVISEAYKCSGKATEISKELCNAKDLMKGLSDNYSDYEHYPALKEYFTTTIAFYDFCCNPEGSFEQVVETFNNYRNNARESFFDLNYIFNNSIGGMDKHTKSEE